MKLKLALLSTALLIAGCQHVSPPVEGREDAYASPQVTFSEVPLRNQTAISAPKLTRDDAGNLLHITLPIRNTTSRAIIIDYKVSFFDRNGSVLSETGWMDKPLEANTREMIEVQSTSDRAADFRIAIRRAK